jgi:carbonic anhydrase
LNVKPSGLVFTGYSTPVTGAVLQNNGHTAQVQLPAGTTPPTLSGGYLTKDYTLASFHFHWGPTDSLGSEHTFNGKPYAGELHFVHYLTSAGSLAAAVNMTSKDAIAVIGVFLNVQKKDNSALSGITSQLAKVPYDGNTATLTSLTLSSLLPTSQSCFYRYSGSLTTPACKQIVAWTVFNQPIGISSAQLAQFRTLYSVMENAQTGHDPHITQNFRPPQPRNGRTVYSVGCSNTC